MRDEILERGDHQRSTRMKIAALLLCFGVAAAAYGLATQGEATGGPDWLPVVWMGAGVVVAVAGLGGVLAWRPNKACRARMESGSYRDRVQREWVSRITILPASTLGLTVISMTQADQWLSGEDPGLSGVLLAAVAVLNLLLIPVMVMGWDGGSRKQRRLLDDELTRAYRAQAMTWAFWTLILGVTALYLVGLWKPHVAIVSMPMVLWAAAAMAALKFSSLHKQADRDDG
jgi:hypothetical protein